MLLLKIAVLIGTGALLGAICTVGYILYSWMKEDGWWGV